MQIWMLVFWALGVPEFEGGQYQSEERCIVAGLRMVETLKPMYGKLKWRCELHRTPTAVM